ncbi:MAG: type II toxin-antitoxin system RelE/ParE family toxin [Candidatus Paceibacterota bacterium]
MVKHVTKLNKAESKVLIKALEEVEENPLNGDFKKLKGVVPTTYRKRVGKFRVLYQLDVDNEIIVIMKAEKRSDNTY